MKVYISGKIGGLQEEIYLKKFKSAQLILESEGHEAVNPCEIEHEHGKTWEEYMLCDIKALFPCDAILMLDNWQDSKGARIEKFIAEQMSKKVYYMRNAFIDA